MPQSLRNPALGYWLSIISIAAFKLWLVSAIAIFGETLAGHDDRLFVNLAVSLWQQQWLGNYNQLTLIKGPGFSFWLVFLHWFHIPLIMGNSALSIIAAIVFSWAIKRLTGSYWWALFCYVLLALNIDINNRVVREGFYASLTVLLFSLTTLQLVNYFINRQIKLLLTIIISMVLVWFWITREEGVWVIPSLVLNAGLLAYLLYREKKPFYHRQVPLFLLLVPFIILFLGINVIKLINGTRYQSWNVVEMKSDAFTGAYGSLARVNPDKRQRFIPVSKASRADIYKVSPAYREISPYLDARNFWDAGCSVYPSTCGEIAGGWFMWALRDAVASAGYYKNGAVAENYYGRLKQEINRACEQKLLTCSPERNTLLPIINRNDISNIVSAFNKGVNDMLNPVIYQAEAMQACWILYGSNGDVTGVDYFSDVIYDTVAPLNHSNNHKIHIQKMQNTIQIDILTGLSKFYSLFFKFLLIVSTLFFIYKTTLMFTKKTTDLLWLINMTLLLAIIIRITILAIIDATSFPGINPIYMSPIYLLALLFILTNLVNVFHQYDITFKREH